MILPERYAILIAYMQKETCETSSRNIGHNQNAYVWCTSETRKKLHLRP